MNTAAAKEKSVARTLDEIIVEVCEDTHPGPDGCSNSDRLHFIMEVLECEVINLNATYNFTPVTRCKTPDLIEASKHIALLQLDYLKQAKVNEHIEEDEYDLHKARLILDIRRLDWHYDHVVAGKPTPPFPFIH